MADAFGASRATLDFFEAQARARARTRLLVALFVFAVAVVVAMVYAAMLVIDATVAPGRPGIGHVAGGIALFRPGLLGATALIVGSVVGCGSAWHAAQLSAGGGEAVARMLGGRLVDRGTHDPLERRLVNVAEEMAIAAGLPVPALYVLDREVGINAFAAGYTPGHTAVAVTRGALERLDRDELQGVVAHELSHVLHQDTRIDLQLMAVVGGLGAMSLLGRWMVAAFDDGRGRRGRKGGALVFLGLALLIAGWIGTVCGKLVRYGVSRQREWLADASAVQFTRNPDGLASALHHIAEEGSTVLSPYAPEAAHLFFASATSGFFEGLFSTHPPLAERIRRIAPGFQPRPRPPPAAAPGGRVPGPSSALAGRAAAPAPPAQAAAQAHAGSADALQRAQVLPTVPARPLPGAILPTVAVPASAPAPAQGAASLLSRLPEAARRETREPFGARCLACALLLEAPSTAPGAAGRAHLRREDGGFAAEVERLADVLAGLGRVERMALLALALPALDALSQAQAAALAADLRVLARVDGALSPFELAVQRVVQRRLARGAGKPPRPTLRSIEDVGPEALTVLATLAWASAPDAAGAQAALDAGARALGASWAWRLPAREELGLARLDATLERLDGAAPGVKAQLLAACGAVALADGELSLDEAELVRAVAAALGLPMPHLSQRGCAPLPPS